MQRLAPLLSATLSERELKIAHNARHQDELLAGTHATECWDAQFEAWLGRGTARAMMGGRAALLAVTRALGLGAGDGVIIPAFTCQCVLNALRFAGVAPQYADIENEGFGLDAAAVARAITPGTRAIMIQHSFGLVGRDFEALLALARERNLLLIEDCAHALGARWQGQLLGTFGDAAVFSFERSKIITTIHGGMAVVHGEAAAMRLQAQAAQAPLPARALTLSQLDSVEHDYWVRVADDPARAAWARGHFAATLMPQMWPEEFRGEHFSRYEERMPSAIALLAQSQFAQLENILAARRKQALRWQAWAGRAGFATASALPGSEPAWLRFPLWADAALKAEPAALARELGVEIGVWFTTPAHPVASVQAHCPQGMDACARVLNLPTLLPAGHPFAT
ncbi:DegT/DnrJ/EryC1/StrS aminotransferase family protein [Rhodobacteraceae bacterium CH30]|nr:DegT/DnrJ/EryC1/StrS aminotransferase family protein [Rhodobacteraceae bacterium CH30]